ncbi:MAG TPA: hypothetical protein VEK33_10775 [Terriglobales bacterium]|nr:hypothetical protein [Terriglobales bacterium]
MSPMRCVAAYILAWGLVCMGLLTAVPRAAPLASQPPASQEGDGQHDFDFNLGTWKARIKRLQHPLTGSSTWVELTGTVVVRRVWGGRAQLEEIEANGSAGRFEGLTLFLYHPQAHQWTQNFANSRSGMLGVPMIGEFKDGRGEFYDQEEFAGRVILVRGIWSDITANSHRFEQSFSEDGGKSWEPNWIATLTRESSGQVPAQPLSDEEVRHDFDFNSGIWKTHVSRLAHPLTGSTTWVDYDGTAVVSKLWNGRASLLELEVDGPAGHIEGVGLRLYNSQSRQWSLNWANSRDGTMTQPMIGEFKDGRGEFFDREFFAGRAIFVRNGFSNITPDSSRFEQAFSDDGGRTWETNWVMNFTRANHATDDAN